MLRGILPAAWQSYTHAALRIMTGLLFAQHGSAKILKIPNLGNMLDGMPSAMIMGTGLVDLIGGILIVLGIFTRNVAFILSGYMAVGYFMAHASQGFFPLLNGGEAAIFFCFIFLFLATAGAGPLSVDASRK